MKINDFAFAYPVGISPHVRGICRVRTFVSQGQVVVVLTDLGSDKNMGHSVTNTIEDIVDALGRRGLVASTTTFVEHYEAKQDSTATFDLINLADSEGQKWRSVGSEYVMTICKCSPDELNDKSLRNNRLLAEVDRMRNAIDPFVDFPSIEEVSETNRRLSIGAGMISKAEVRALVEGAAGERALQSLLKSDLSFFGEIYGAPTDEYICFSEFPVDDGFADFAVFTGRSRMDVVLVEIKGADFLLANQDSYGAFSHKISQAAEQIQKRVGNVFRNYEHFRQEVHRIRAVAEAGTSIHNSFLGPSGRLLVSPEKDVNIRTVVIGGRTRDDLEESAKRHDYEARFSPPIRIESWDTWLRRLQRR